MSFNIYGPSKLTRNLSKNIKSFGALNKILNSLDLDIILQPTTVKVGPIAKVNTKNVNGSLDNVLNCFAYVDFGAHRVEQSQITDEKIAIQSLLIKALVDFIYSTVDDELKKEAFDLMRTDGLKVYERLQQCAQSGNKQAEEILEYVKNSNYHGVEKSFKQLLKEPTIVSIFNQTASDAPVVDWSLYWKRALTMAQPSEREDKNNPWFTSDTLGLYVQAHAPYADDDSLLVTDFGETSLQSEKDLLSMEIEEIENKPTRWNFLARLFDQTVEVLTEQKKYNAECFDRLVKLMDNIPRSPNQTARDLLTAMQHSNQEIQAKAAAVLTANIFEFSTDAQAIEAAHNARILLSDLSKQLDLDQDNLFDKQTQMLKILNHAAQHISHTAILTGGCLPADKEQITNLVRSLVLYPYFYQTLLSSVDIIKYESNKKGNNNLIDRFGENYVQQAAKILKQYKEITNTSVYQKDLSLQQAQTQTLDIKQRIETEILKKYKKRGDKRIPNLSVDFFNDMSNTARLLEYKAVWPALKTADQNFLAFSSGFDQQFFSDQAGFLLQIKEYQAIFDQINLSQANLENYVVELSECFKAIYQALVQTRGTGRFDPIGDRLDQITELSKQTENSFLHPVSRSVVKTISDNFGLYDPQGFRSPSGQKEILPQEKFAAEKCLSFVQNYWKNLTPDQTKMVLELTEPEIKQLCGQITKAIDDCDINVKLLN